MAIDLSPAFHVALYLLFLESMLFFAVIMQTKSVEPGTHSGIARYFGMVFLFQALAAFFTALSEQFYAGGVSLYFAFLAMASTVVAVCLCIPAAVAVAVPEPNQTILQAAVFLSGVVTTIVATMLVGPMLNAAPDIPYLDGPLRRNLLAAIGGAVIVLAVAALVRMGRRMKGKNGAFILLAGLGVSVVFGVLWAKLEPLCKQTVVGGPWPEQCPVSRTFDHNFMIVVFIMAANVLAAEGVLRLMAAGTGVEGYVEIVPVIQMD